MADVEPVEPKQRQILFWPNTRPETVKDPTGRHIVVGKDHHIKIAALIKRYHDRVTSFHVKDLARPGENANEDGWADVGHGVLDWKALLPVMRDTPADVWVLEHDNPSDDARFARRAFAAVQSW